MGEHVTGLPLVEPTEGATPPDRRRFVRVALLANGLAALPFLWILWFLWGPFNFFRSTTYEANFYDIQASAMLHGHLWIPKGSLGVEGFLVGGHEYTYFGLFSSLLRMPVIELFPGLANRLTAPFMLVAWLLTCLFTAMLIWRLRMMVRGGVAMGRGELLTLGLLMGTVAGGSVLLFLAAVPYTFSEDLMWSVCLSVGCILVLLGMVERPSWSRWLACVPFLIFVNQNRLTTGWGCALAGLLVAAWMWFSPKVEDGRRWALRLGALSVIAVGLGCLVNEIKFGSLFGLPIQDQVYTLTNAYRRHFLRVSGGEEGVVFLPSNLLAYLRPDALRLTSSFPFITLPAAPASSVDGVLFDRLYRTASVTASMPFLFLLAAWGVVVALGRRARGQLAAVRWIILSIGGAAAALMVWGYIAPRYLADFLPLFVLAGSLGAIDLWRRLEGSSRTTRRWWVVGLVTVAAFTIWANIGISVTPNEEWSTDQVTNYLKVQQSVANLTGVSLKDRVATGTALPLWGPADRLFIVGDCDGLYLSTGEKYGAAPTEQYQRATWLTAELGPGFHHTFSARFSPLPAGARTSVRLVTIGGQSLDLTVLSGPASEVTLVFSLRGPEGVGYGYRLAVPTNETENLSVITDTAKHSASVTVNSELVLALPLRTGAPISASGSLDSGGVSIVNTTSLQPRPTLCESLR